MKKILDNIKKNFEVEKGRLAVISLLCLFALFYFFHSMFITIHPGFVGVKFNRLFGGSVTNKIYPDGFYVIFPWDKIYPYEVRIQGFNQAVPVICQNGLRLTVSIAVRFHPDPNRLPLLHLSVGPDYLNKVVIPVAVSSTRNVVGKYKPEEAYSIASQRMQDEILIEIISELGNIPILYDSIVIENIELPPAINEAIQMKLRQEQKYLEYEFRIKAEQKEIERKKLEAQGIEAFNETVKRSLTGDLLTWFGIVATKELASSPNSKVVVIGGGKNGLPIILNAENVPVSPGSPEGSPLTGERDKQASEPGKSLGGETGGKASDSTPLRNDVQDSTSAPPASKGRK
jgi:regulator of protease activity HflC (stomatin/prohibitin superfamily)